MATFQTKKDPLLRGVSPTPSKIPVRSKRRPPLPSPKPCDLERENQDPKRLEQKSSTQRPLVDSAGHRPKATHQTQKSERLVGSTVLRKPLEELRPSPKEQSVGPGPPPQKEIPGAIEFVADPEALATILSGEGVKSWRLGRQPSLAQRVLVRESQGGTIRRGQGARASAYLAPRTPQARLDPARASCFSRLEGPGPRSWTLCPQKLEAVIPPSGPSFHSSARPGFQELKRETGGSSRTAVSQASGLHLETPAQPASSVLEGEHEVVTRSDEEGRGPPGPAQWVPLRESRELTHTKDSRDCHPMPSPGPVLLPSVPRPSPFGLAKRVPSPGSSAPPSYSVLRRLAIRPKTQFTPIPSAPKAQQAPCLSGLSPQSCPEEPALPWEQIAVRLFDQESCRRLQEGPGKLPAAMPHGPQPSRTPNLQELKMQRISILKQLLQQEVDGLAGSKCVPPNGGSSLDMAELQSLLAEIPRTPSGPELDSGAFRPPELIQHSGLPMPCLPEEGGEPQLGPGAEPEAAQPCPPAEPGPPEPCLRREPEVPEPTPQKQPEVPEPTPQKQPEVPEPSAQKQPEVPEPTAQKQPEIPEPTPQKQPEVPEPTPRKQPEVPEPTPRKQPEVPEPTPRKQPEVPEPTPRKQPEVPEPTPRKQPEVPEPTAQKQPEIPEPTPQKQPEVPEPTPRKQPEVPEPTPRKQPEVPEPTPRKQPEASEARPPVEPGPVQACAQRQTGLPEPSPRAEAEAEASELCPLEPRGTGSSPQSCCSQWAPAQTTSVISSQRPLCASPTVHSLQSLRPPAGQAGPSNLAPRTLALRQRLKACLTAIHCFHEVRLDDECAFYTSRAPPAGPSRVCTNPVAKLLDWQDALCFIPIGAAAPPDSPT
ncbi:tastin isoform X3 [Pipistrellus kuhlii]|uniref:tastin isoform X3 n=1 Tax=Pipistrellus kuhlii TaxID=59472 RepID=UPI001E27135C|nr:tastin isoform X3 [Pipistrellus kuhlii]